MNTIDLVLGIIFIIAFFLGFRKGLLRSLASLIGLVAGVYCAMFFSGYVTDYLERWFQWSDDINTVVAFLIVFFLIMFLFALIGRLLTKMADFALMGLVNKIFGGIFNVLKYAFIISVVFMFVNNSADYRISTPSKRDASLLYHPVASLAPMLLPAIMEKVDEIEEIDPALPNENDGTNTE